VIRRESSYSDGHPESGTRKGLLILSLVFASVTLQVWLIRMLYPPGGVPLFILGTCQYVPGLLVLILLPEWRPRLWFLFRNRPTAGSLVFYYLLTVGVLAACLLSSYALGHQAAEFSGERIQAYPLKHLVPGPLLKPTLYPFFILLGAPVIHLVNAAGEEVLWRGYLLDWLLERFSTRSAFVLDGLLWGLWHAPMIALLDWDFPGYIFGGVLMITGSMIFWSLVMCEIRLLTDSLWIPCIMHAVANALTFGFYDVFMDHRYNLFFSPWGGVGAAVMAAFSLRILLGSSFVQQRSVSQSRP